MKKIDINLKEKLEIEKIKDVNRDKLNTVLQI